MIRGGETYHESAGNILHTPKLLTKELQLQRVAVTGQRRIRLSTNFLRGFGFNPGIRLKALPCPEGFDLVTTTDLGHRFIKTFTNQSVE